ncbi:50S ribosome-binding GTPase [Dehalococcoidales bacterium]|nr:50S ribosome-binding GTPase [Dehalococcoidales bacterium]MCL0094816.1 50S ribosome-binding GTPase [Dehalococcoidales bacterium]
MPANLPPQYFEAEKNYRLAKTTSEKIAALEEMLAIMPKHKGTDKLRAELRRRIAKLTQASEKKSATQRATMVIEKEGAGQVAVIGLVNAGKSQLVCSITNASPTVAEYPYTTRTAIPGMMEFENIKIQLIDTPPLMPRSNEPWLRHMLIRADALLVVVDLSNAPLAQIEAITTQLENMKIGKKKTLIIGNKLDLENAKENYIALNEQLPVIAISAKERIGLEELKLKIYQMLDIIRVYTKAPGQKPDFDEPIVLERGSTVADAAAEVHKDFATKLKYARIWGSGKHNGLMVKRDHILQDGDVIELHL